MPDRDRVTGGLAALVLFLGDKGDPISTEQAGICADALALLREQEPRVLAAEEVQHLPDKTVICVEQLLSREDEERGYITGMAWGIVCNRTNAPDGGLILSMLGTFFPDTVRAIPYETTYRDKNTKKRRTTVYRFWTDRPTNEQSKAVKWDET